MNCNLANAHLANEVFTKHHNVKWEKKKRLHPRDSYWCPSNCD